MLDCFLIIDEPRSGPENMAADEWCALLAGRENRPVLRLYRWHPPTLSLGYFQRLEDRLQHPASHGCPVVRRPSGGGAILHDLEWTYSLSLPVSHPLARDRLALYTTVHQTLIRWLQAQGVAARILGGSGRAEGCATPSAGGCPFLCFQRRTAGDIVADIPLGPRGNSSEICTASTWKESQNAHQHSAEVKLVGSAQRRTQHAVLQHGSILLGRSPYAPELPGLWEVLGNSQTLSSGHELFSHFVMRWPAMLAETLRWRLIPCPVFWQGEASFRELLCKYQSREWTEKLTPS